MKAFSRRFICQLLIVSIAALPFSAPTRAALIATDQVVASDQARGDRDKLRDFVARADVRNQLGALGVSPAAAMHRVDALSDDEVQQLAGRIDSLPAGAHGGEIGLGGVLIILLLVSLIILLFDKRSHSRR